MSPNQCIYILHGHGSEIMFRLYFTNIRPRLLADHALDTISSHTSCLSVHDTFISIHKQEKKKDRDTEHEREGEGDRKGR